MNRIWKQGLLLLLAIVLLVGTAQAAQTPTLSIASGTVKAGGSVTLDVTIKDNPGIATTMVYFYYDTDTFTVDPGADISAKGAFARSGGLIGNSIATAKENGRYEGKAGKDGVLALWYNGSGMNTDGDGAVFSICLHAKKDAANGEYKIELGLADDATYNETEQIVPMTADNGVITVTGGKKEQSSKEEKEESSTSRGDDEDEKETPLFKDVSGNWAEHYIEEAAERDLVVGHEGLYRPNDTMTRAEFVTILWRAKGEPAPTAKASFTDLTQTWYLDAVAWAEQNAVVNGIGYGKFDPNGTVTREQIATILHRLAGTPSGMELMLTGIYDGQYPDSKDVGSWAKSALYWSIYNGIYCGVDSEKIGGSLSPKLAATRAQIAVMIVRYLDKVG